MPAAVEVIAAGIRLVYPTSYVLVTDYDSMHNDTTNLSEFSGGAHSTKKSMHTCEMLDDVALMGSDVYHVEPSPFATSNHPLLGNTTHNLKVGLSHDTMTSYKSCLLNKT